MCSTRPARRRNRQWTESVRTTTCQLRIAGDSRKYVAWLTVREYHRAGGPAANGNSLSHDIWVPRVPRIWAPGRPRTSPAVSTWVAIQFRPTGDATRPDPLRTYGEFPLPHLL